MNDNNPEPDASRITAQDDEKMPQEAAPKKPFKRRAKIPTAESLANIALFYLSRFAASEGSLRRVLKNRLRRAAMLDDGFGKDRDKQATLHAVIETIIEKHRKSGVLNDAAYAGMRVQSLRRSGRSRRYIEKALGQKGVGSAEIKKALEESNDRLDPVESEMKAALAFAKRKKLGPFGKKAKDADQARKDLGAMARAGFTLDIAKKILGSEIDEDIFDDAS